MGRPDTDNDINSKLRNLCKSRKHSERSGAILNQRRELHIIFTSNAEHDLFKCKLEQREREMTFYGCEPFGQKEVQLMNSVQ